MKISDWRATAAALGLAALAGSAAAELILLEEAIESTTYATALPEGGGTLIVKKCDECDPIILRVDAQTTSFIGYDQVSYAELQRASRQVRAGLDIFYDAESGRVTRLKLSHASSAGPKGQTR